MVPQNVNTLLDTLRYGHTNFSRDAIFFIVGIYFHREAVTRNLFSKREAFFEISENRNPSKITRYTILAISIGKV